MLPPVFVMGHPALQRHHQELVRKFGVYRHEKPKGITFRGATALPEKAYEKMSDTDWMNSFVEYDERKEKRWYDGVDESAHAQQFTIEVKKNPSRFIHLLEGIITNPATPNSYVFHGLEGLTGSKANLPILKRLLFKSMDRFSGSSSMINFVRLTDGFIKQDKPDEDIFKFLQQVALSGGEEDTNDSNLLDRGINQPRGAAVWQLIQYAKYERFVDAIFDTLEQVAQNASLSTRAAALNYQATLNRHNPLRSLHLFIALGRNYEQELASSATYSLQYNIHIDFPQLVPFFERAIGADSAMHQLAQLLMVAYKYNYSESERLLEMYLDTGEEAVTGALVIALHGLKDKNPDLKGRCEKLVYRYLDSQEEKVGLAYEHGFEEFEVDDFTQLIPFIERYTRAAVGRFRGRSFYKYLLHCVKDFPMECIQWAASFDTHEVPDIRYRRVQQEPVEVVLQGYNAFQQYAEPVESLEAAMNIFDRLLQTPAYRAEAEEMIDSID